MALGEGRKITVVDSAETYLLVTLTKEGTLEIQTDLCAGHTATVLIDVIHAAVHTPTLLGCPVCSMERDHEPDEGRPT